LVMGSVTERVNLLAEGIDGCDGYGIVARLCACDGELFGVPGYEGRDASLGSSGFVRGVARLAEAVHGCLGAGGDVVVAGAGTSGRLAFKACRSLNAVLERGGEDAAAWGRFHYLIAGGDAALFESQEGAEDSQRAAVEDLQRLRAALDAAGPRPRPRPMLVVGITCGLSATYVGALMDAALDGSGVGMRACLIGFNPVELARDLRVPDWPGRTFKDVVRRMEAAEDALMVLPVVGPEAICGSTRMKGGTATKVVLEVGLGLGATRLIGGPVPALGPSEAGSPWDAAADAEDATEAAAAACLARYAQAVAAVYREADALARAVEAGGAALRAGGRVFYLGRGDAGIVGVVDASEQRPTYGAGVDDFRGFIVGGRAAFYGRAKPLEATTTTTTTPGDGAFVASLEAKLGTEEWFMGQVLPGLSARDLIVVCSLDGEGQAPLPRALVDAMVTRRRASAFGLAAVLVPTLGAADAREEGDEDVLQAWGRLGWGLAAAVSVDLASGGMLADGIPGPAEVALKLALNALSTGAHVLKGKVYGCRMIDVKVSNIKLFHRSVSIVKETAGVGVGKAAVCLLAAVHGTFPEWGPNKAKAAGEGDGVYEGFEDTVTEDVIAAAVGKAILMASVVPCAILLATGLASSPDLGFAAIRREPVLRRHLEGTVV